MFQKKTGVKIKKSHIITLGLVIITALVLRIFQLQFSDTQVELKGESLHVLVAKTPKQWYKGLGGRKDLGEYDGMLFLFPFYEKHTFVMHDMQFPLDMIWFAGGTVVDIAPDVPVWPQDRPYIPRVEANAVLELPAGWAKAHRLEIGDNLRAAQE